MYSCRRINMKEATHLALVLVVMVTLVLVARTDGLSLDYYNQAGHSCPQATNKIKSIIGAEVVKDNGLAAKLLRMHFHDCFVRGCDASVLIYKANGTAERDGPPNANSLGGFEALDKAKAAVESLCPRTVSCADIVALAARDAVVALSSIRGPFGPSVSWDVPLGRKDGNQSNFVETFQLPPPNSNAAQLIANFAAKGLNISQMVVLSGAHTIGSANCTVSNNRLYNFTGVGGQDPSLDPAYANYLKSECPANIQTVRIAMKDFLTNPFSNNGTFDNQYYVNVKQNKGLFTSDAALITSVLTQPFVDLYAANAAKFISDFKAAMIAMGNIGVLTTGYVRKNCSVAFS